MRKLIFGIFAILLSATLFAAPRTAEQAARLAAEFTNSQPQFSHIRKSVRNAEPLRLAHTVAKPASSEAAFYIFNRPDNGGWVIISADDNARTVLGYSTEGAFNAARIPSNVQFWFDYQAERVAAAKPTAKVKRLRRSITTTAIAPLLGEIKWNQNSPYNDQCPIDPVDDTRSATGCVATAAAQIMRYWKWPAQGQGSHSYTWTNEKGGSGTESVNFGEATYNWDNMLEKYTSSATTAQKTEVAKLMYHVGVSCDMTYGGDKVGGSGAFTNNMGDALVSYFRYKNTATFKKNQTTEQRSSLFTTELQAGRPILMGGETSDRKYGHEFVCDGLDSDGLFHINWGWGGTSNGYFSLSSLDPDEEGIGGAASGDGYATNIDCVIGIQPDKDPVNVTSVTVAPSTLTLKIKERGQLTATVAPEDASNKALVWSSSDESIAKVNASGVVIGVSAGNATITATTNDGNKTSSCAVTVTDEYATATLLEVDKGYAEYDDYYDDPWTICVYNSTTTGKIPYIYFYPDGKETSKIAGVYTLGNGGGVLWNDPNDPDDSNVHITSGQLVVTCLSQGTDGCNTYRVLSYFTCDDGAEYKVDVTLELCGKDGDGNAISLTDAVSTSTSYEVTWLVSGEDFTANLALDGKVTIPADQPAACSANSKEFVGWCADENYNSNTAPTLVKDGDEITANTTYYAVFGTPNGSSTPSEVASVTFKTASNDDGTNRETSEAIKNNVVQSDSGIEAYSGSYLYKGKSGAKLGNSSSSGSITLTLSSKASVSKVVVNGVKYGSDTGKLKVTAGTKELGSETPANNLQFTSDPATETNTIKIETTSGRAYIASISVIAGNKTYTGFTTTCGEPAQKYGITINEAQNGSLATSPASEAAAGRKVTVTALPATYYQLATLTVKDADNGNVTVSGTSNTRTFIMPAKAVTISGTFEEQPKYTVRFISNGTEVSSNQYFNGQTATKPADPSTGCEYSTFAGWWTEELPSSNTTAQTWVTNFKVTGEQDYYAIFSRTVSSGSGEASFDGSNGGVFKIYANVSGTKYYAKETTYINTESNKKITSTTNASEATQYTLTKVSGGFTIKDGDKYVAYSGTSGTNIVKQDGAYTWNIVSSTAGYGSWRVNATTGSNRALAFSSGLSAFGGYSTTNIGNNYYDLEIGGAGPVSTTYYSSTIDCTPTSIEECPTIGNPSTIIKQIVNGQLVIIVDGKKYNAIGQTIE